MKGEHLSRVAEGNRGFFDQGGLEIDKRGLVEELWLLGKAKDGAMCVRVCFAGKGREGRGRRRLGSGQCHPKPGPSLCDTTRAFLCKGEIPTYTARYI